MGRDIDVWHPYRTYAQEMVIANTAWAAGVYIHRLILVRIAHVVEAGVVYHYRT